jgi:TLD
MKDESYCLHVQKHQQLQSRTMKENGHISGSIGESVSSIYTGAANVTPRIEYLRETVGEYGIALFAPLLDFVVVSDDENDDDSITRTTNRTHRTHHNKSVTSSTCTTITMRTEPESDHCQSDEDDLYDDDVYNDDDEPNVMIQNDSSPTLTIKSESFLQLQACPRILSECQMQYLQQYLPYSIRDNIWERRFMIGLHGDSFCTLLQKCAGYKHSIVVVRSVCGHILGGYASEEWRIRDEVFQSSRGAYYGTGQSFVFGTRQATMNSGVDEEQYVIEDDALCVYQWTGHNDYCQICDAERSVLCMGGVGEFGWIVSDNFTVGQTGSCATFNNPPLIYPTTFQIADFEIYVLVSPIFGF